MTAVDVLGNRDEVADGSSGSYEKVEIGDPELWIPTPELESLLDQGLRRVEPGLGSTGAQAAAALLAPGVTTGTGARDLGGPRALAFGKTTTAGASVRSGLSRDQIHGHATPPLAKRSARGRRSGGASWLGLAISRP